MSGGFRFVTWCKSIRGVGAILVVLTSGLFLGYYAWLVFAAPGSPTYRLDFGNARWIGSYEKGPNAYFRKKIFISDPIVQAWLQVAASDNFRVYVNNVAINNPDPTLASPGFTGSSVSANPTVLLDISRYLTIGTNVIAINVLRDTYPGTAKLIVRGDIRMNSAHQEIVSDGSWKAASTLGLVQNLLYWTDPLQDDNLWPNAEPLATQADHRNLNQPVVVPPQLFQAPLQGLWIADSQSKGKQINFTRHFDLVSGAKESWLQVAANGSYSVILNGHWLEDYVPVTSLGPYNPAPISLQFVWLQPWLRLKDNELTVRVQSLDTAPLLIGQISLLSGSNEVLQAIGTDEKWTASDVRSRVAPGPLRHVLAMKDIAYSGGRWGVPPQLPLAAPLSTTENTSRTSSGILILSLVVVGGCGLWLLSAWLLAIRQDYRFGDALCFDAVLHTPILLLVPLLLLLRYDVRLRPETPMQPEFFFGLAALIVVLRLFAWFLPVPHKIGKPKQRFQLSQWLTKHWFGVGLGLIVVFAFYQRVIGINAFPLHHDDIFIQNCARGIFQKGYPGLNYGGVPLRLVTYELVPYPIALSTILFGWSDWAVRIPPLVFGTLTALVVGRIGRRLFDRRVGLLAAFLYSCNPWNVYWALHCFHPQQAQFFALLCMWDFYSAIQQPGEINKKYFYRCCLFFCLTYLSWEGTGFLLPAFAIALVTLHPGRWGWLRQFHLWVGLFVVGSIVVMQFASRYMAMPPYISLGYSLADLGSPTLYFLDPQCEPLFYLTWVFLVGPNFLLTLCLLPGLLFVRKSPPLRYCMVMFGGLLLSFSVFLSAYSVRYCYFYQDLLFLMVSANLFMIWDRAALLTRRWEWGFGKMVLAGTALAALALVCISNTNAGLMLHRIGGDKVSQIGLSYWLRWEDTASAARYIAANRRPGDVVVARLTQAMERYGGRLPEYALDDLLEPRVVYDNTRETPYYENRQTNIPVLDDYDQVMRLFREGHRIWYISPTELYTPGTVLKNGPQLLTAASREVYGAYNSYVYLWEGLIPDPDKVMTNLAVQPNPPVTADYVSLPRTGMDPVNSSFAELPFRFPLTPEVEIEPETTSYTPPKPPAPDAMLIPTTGSLLPALRPTPTPFLAPPLLNQ